MMHEHKSTKCEHELQHCAHCNVVFCELCKTEWHSKTITIINNTATDPFKYPYQNPKVWYDGTPVVIDAVSYCRHDQLGTAH